MSWNSKQKKMTTQTNKFAIKVWKWNALVKQVLNNFSNFPLTSLTMPQKFYLDKILLHAPITFGEGWKCPACNTRVLQF